MSSISENIIQNPENDFLDPFKPLFVETVDEIVDSEFTREESQRLGQMEEYENYLSNKKSEGALLQNKSIDFIFKDIANNLLKLFLGLFEYSGPDSQYFEYLKSKLDIFSLGTLLFTVGVFLLVI